VSSPIGQLRIHVHRYVLICSRALAPLLTHFEIMLAGKVSLRNQNFGLGRIQTCFLLPNLTGLLCKIVDVCEVGTFTFHLVEVFSRNTYPVHHNVCC
jgi:hypothetical protein